MGGKPIRVGEFSIPTGMIPTHLSDIDPINVELSNPAEFARPVDYSSTATFADYDLPYYTTSEPDPVPPWPSDLYQRWRDYTLDKTLGGHLTSDVNPKFKAKTKHTLYARWWWQTGPTTLVWTRVPVVLERDFSDFELGEVTGSVNFTVTIGEPVPPSGTPTSIGVYWTFSYQYQGFASVGNGTQVTNTPNTTINISATAPGNWLTSYTLFTALTVSLSPLSVNWATVFNDSNLLTVSVNADDYGASLTALADDDFIGFENVEGNYFIYGFQISIMSWYGLTPFRYYIIDFDKDSGSLTVVGYFDILGHRDQYSVQANTNGGRIFRKPLSITGMGDRYVVLANADDSYYWWSETNIQAGETAATTAPFSFHLIRLSSDYSTATYIDDDWMPSTLFLWDPETNDAKNIGDNLMLFCRTRSRFENGERTEIAVLEVSPSSIVLRDYVFNSLAPSWPDFPGNYVAPPVRITQSAWSNGTERQYYINNVDSYDPGFLKASVNVDHSTKQITNSASVFTGALSTSDFMGYVETSKGLVVVGNMNYSYTEGRPFYYDSTLPSPYLIALDIVQPDGTVITKPDDLFEYDVDTNYKHYLEFVNFSWGGTKANTGIGLVRYTPSMVPYVTPNYYIASIDLCEQKIYLSDYYSNVSNHDDINMRYYASSESPGYYQLAFASLSTGYKFVVWQLAETNCNKNVIGLRFNQRDDGSGINEGHQRINYSPQLGTDNSRIPGSNW